MTAERDSERGLEHLGVVRGSFDSWRFGPASAVLHDPADLGHSRYRAGDRAMVFVERPIDAIAYERAHGKQHATYVYTGDNPSPRRSGRSATSSPSAPANLTVVAALSKSSRGAALAEEIAELAGRRPVERRTPEFGSRWADQMQIGAAPSRLAHPHSSPPGPGRRQRSPGDGQSPRRRRRPARDQDRHHQPAAPRPARTRTIATNRIHHLHSKDLTMLSNRYLAIVALLTLCRLPDEELRSRAGRAPPAPAAPPAAATGGAGEASWTVDARRRRRRARATKLPPDAAVGQSGEADRRWLRRELRVRLRLLRRRRLLQHRLRRPVLHLQPSRQRSATAPARSAATTPPRPRPARGPTPARSRSPSSTFPPAGLKDLQVCKVNADCASLNCVTFYVDHDGDGYGETAKTIQFCEEQGAAPPVGYVSQGGDCCDSDANAYPGQTKYFTSANACGSCDYNCDGTIQDAKQPIRHLRDGPCQRVRDDGARHRLPRLVHRDDLLPLTAFLTQRHERTHAHAHHQASLVHRTRRCPWSLSRVVPTTPPATIPIRNPMPETRSRTLRRRPVDVNVTVPRNPLGTACSSNTDCTSGFCTDGVCCDSACGQTCYSCAQQAALGHCAPLTSGQDPNATDRLHGSVSVLLAGLEQRSGLQVRRWNRLPKPRRLRQRSLPDLLRRR